jgi:hypothetical protein
MVCRETSIVFFSLEPDSASRGIKEKYVFSIKVNGTHNHYCPRKNFRWRHWARNCVKQIMAFVANRPWLYTFSVWPRYDSESDLRIPTDRQTLHSRQVCLHNLRSNVLQTSLFDQRSSGFLFETWPVIILLPRVFRCNSLCRMLSIIAHTGILFVRPSVCRHFLFSLYFTHTLSTLSLRWQLNLGSYYWCVFVFA